MSKSQQTSVTTSNAQKVPDTNKSSNPPVAKMTPVTSKSLQTEEAKPKADTTVSNVTNISDVSNLSNGPTKPNAKTENREKATTNKNSTTTSTKQNLLVGDSKDNIGSDTVEGSAASAKKKSSFQITKVVDVEGDLNDTKDATDDLDDANTDELSSDVVESSRQVEAERNVMTQPVNTSKQPTTSTVVKRAASVIQSTTPSKAKDNHSRFKIVKIESKDHSKRGRWTCFDFADPLGSNVALEQSSVQNGRVNGATNTSTVDPIYYFPSVEPHNSKSPFAPAIVYNEGHPVLERNPLELPQSQFFNGVDWQTSGTSIAGSVANGTLNQNKTAGTTDTSSSLRLNQLNEKLVASAVAVDIAAAAQQAELDTASDPTPLLSPRSNAEFISMLSKRSSQQGSPLLAMVSAINPDGAMESEDSSNSNVAIDNKIEQAMDLVKSHLMFAVREEVEILKEQIKELLAKNSQLEYENSILRAEATPETLAKLQATL